MNNWFFGDVNDYQKYGLLRAIQSVTEFQILVAWMLTSYNPKSRQLTNYLSQPNKWRNYDPELFDQLCDYLKSPPNVSLIENSELLPKTRYYNTLIHDDKKSRDPWIKGLLKQAYGADLIFLDPDNGLEVKSKPLGRKDSAKYLYWEEVDLLWKSGASLLIYQHFPRQKREVFIPRITTKLRQHTPKAAIEAFRTPHMLALLAIQPRHKKQLPDICKKIKEKGSRLPGKKENRLTRVSGKT